MLDQPHTPSDISHMIISMLGMTRYEMMQHAEARMRLARTSGDFNLWSDVLATLRQEG
jgi:hypothetical protein